MLVLSRKTNEKIHIGDSIVVTVLSIKGSTVRIGVEAPRSVRIIRSELEPLADVSQSSESTSALPSVSAPSVSPSSVTSPSAPVPAPIEIADEADDIVGARLPGLSPATHNRLSHLTMPVTQFVARPR